MTEVKLGICEAVTCSRAVAACGESCVVVRVSLKDELPSAGAEGFRGAHHVELLIPARLAWIAGTTIAALSIPQAQSRRGIDAA